MTKTISMAKAIKTINPDARVSIEDDNYDTIEWLFDTPVISKADIDAKIVVLQAEEEAKVQAQIDLKESAKAKLMAGEPMTEAEANLTLHIEE